MGSNKNEKRKPKSAVYRSFWASVVYFHLRLISTKNHKGEMTRNAAGRFPRRVGSTPTISVRKPEAVNKTGTLQNYSFCNVPVCVLSLNWLTRPFSICACPESSSLAAALSSAVAELFCTIPEICSTPCVTWTMEAACSPDALDIFSTTTTTCLALSTTSVSVRAVSSASLVPECTACIVPSISAAVLLEAFAELSARIRTSSLWRQSLSPPYRRGPLPPRHSGQEA